MTLSFFQLPLFEEVLHWNTLIIIQAIQRFAFEGSCYFSMAGHILSLIFSVFCILNLLRTKLSGNSLVYQTQTSFYWRHLLIIQTQKWGNDPNCLTFLTKRFFSSPFRWSKLWLLHLHFGWHILPWIHFHLCASLAPFLDLFLWGKLLWTALVITNLIGCNLFH